MLPKISPTFAAQRPRAACGLACAAPFPPDLCACARQKSSSPNPRSQEIGRPVPPVFPRLDHRRKEVYDADHPQGVFPCLCSPQRVAKTSLHYLGKCSKRILYGREDTSAQEIEAGAAVHGALDQLQTMNVTFNGTIAPVVLKSGLDGSFISAEMFGERSKQAV